jgi:SP family sugar:H+ symporter-like MFS transporter
VANFLVTVSFPAMSDFSLPFSYGMYAVFAALSFFFVFFKIPETNGMALEHAETLFREAGGRARGVQVRSSGDSA